MNFFTALSITLSTLLVFVDANEDPFFKSGEPFRLASNPLIRPYLQDAIPTAVVFTDSNNDNIQWDFIARWTNRDPIRGRSTLPIEYSYVESLNKKNHHATMTASCIELTRNVVSDIQILSEKRGVRDNSKIEVFQDFEAQLRNCRIAQRSDGQQQTEIEHSIISVPFVSVRQEVDSPLQYPIINLPALQPEGDDATSQYLDYAIGASSVPVVVLSCSSDLTNQMSIAKISERRLAKHAIFVIADSESCLTESQIINPDLVKRAWEVVCDHDYGSDFGGFAVFKRSLSAKDEKKEFLNNPFWSAVLEYDQLNSMLRTDCSQRLGLDAFKRAARRAIIRQSNSHRWESTIMESTTYLSERMDEFSLELKEKDEKPVKLSQLVATQINQMLQNIGHNEDHFIRKSASSFMNELLTNVEVLSLLRSIDSNNGQDVKNIWSTIIQNIESDFNSLQKGTVNGSSDKDMLPVVVSNTLAKFWSKIESSCAWGKYAIDISKTVQSQADDIIQSSSESRSVRDYLKKCAKITTAELERELMDRVPIIQATARLALSSPVFLATYKTLKISIYIQLVKKFYSDQERVLLSKLNDLTDTGYLESMIGQAKFVFSGTVAARMNTFVNSFDRSTNEADRILNTLKATPGGLIVADTLENNGFKKYFDRASQAQKKDFMSLLKSHHSPMRRWFSCPDQKWCTKAIAYGLAKKIRSQDTRNSNPKDVKPAWIMAVAEVSAMLLISINSAVENVWATTYQSYLTKWPNLFKTHVSQSYMKNDEDNDTVSLFKSKKNAYDIRKKLNFLLEFHNMLNRNSRL